MQTTYLQKNGTVQKIAATGSMTSVPDSSSQSESLQRKADMANNAAQRAEAPRPNNTGMPDNLKSGIESLSGFSMDDVRVHYNSSKPATVQALAYTQGTDIHVAPGQEKCLPHEAWHVAQQMAGRVSPTTNINGMPVNDNAGLEHEADVMGERAVAQRIESNENIKNIQCGDNLSVLQCESEKEKVASLFRFFKGIGSLRNAYKKISESENEYPLDVCHYIKKIILLLDQCCSSSCFFALLCNKYLFGRECMTFMINFITLVSEPVEKQIFNFVNLYMDRNLDLLNDKTYFLEIDWMVDEYQEGKKKGEILSYDDIKQRLFSDEDVSSERINKLFGQGVRCLLRIYESGKKGVDCSGILEQFLTEDMACYGDKFGKSIYDFVNEQLHCYKGNFCRQFSAMILGVARKIAYVLGDPWAENRIARLLNERVNNDVGENEVSRDSIFFNQVSTFARSNPILMYVNRELNEQDARHLIRIRGARAYGIDCQESYDKMFDELRIDANVVLNAMLKTNAFLDDEKSFSPSKLGMFRLYRKDKYEKMFFEQDISKLKNFDIRNDNGFVDARDEWRKNALENDVRELNQDVSEDEIKLYGPILEKLKDAKITIRLHSSDLCYQKRPDDKNDPWFYHAKPWFKSVEIGGKKVPYHPSSGRDGNNHYSLWRTYKDHFYRGMPWRRGRDGITTGACSQSISKGGAIQQSFGALNFNYKKNCYGLFGGYGYGNISLVLKEDVKKNCIFTVHDKGIPYTSIYAIASALVKLGNKKNIVDDLQNEDYMQMTCAFVYNFADQDEHLEVQIFQDIEFGPNGDVAKIVCVGVTDDEYGQLLEMVGAPVERDDKGVLKEKDEYKNYVERY